MMTNFRINNHVTRSSLIASMKKAISIVLVMLMMFSLAACGNSSDNTTAQTSGKENRVTTEEQMSTQERAGDPIDEPNQEIDEGVNLPTDTEEDTEEVTTEAPSNPQPQGKYTYTIYDGIEISMDVNVDDYIAPNNKGVPYFKIYYLAEDLGWEETKPNDDGFGQQFDYHTSSGPVVQFYVAADNEKPDGWNENRLSMIAYHFTDGAPSYDFYYSLDDIKDNQKRRSLFIYENANPVDYGLPGGFGSAISRDDAIMIAYLLWEPTILDGETEAHSLLEKYNNGGGAMITDYLIDQLDQPSQKLRSWRSFFMPQSYDIVDYQKSHHKLESLLYS